MCVEETGEQSGKMAKAQKQGPQSWPFLQLQLKQISFEPEGGKSLFSILNYTYEFTWQKKSTNKIIKNQCIFSLKSLNILFLSNWITRNIQDVNSLGTTFSYINGDE